MPSERQLRAAAKANEITSGTTIATYGKLNAAQRKQFYQWIINESLYLQKIQVLPMAGPTADLDNFSIAQRVVRAATEATAPSNTTITTAKRSLSTTEIILSWEPTRNWVEDNIAGSTGLTQVIQGFATTWGNDLADLAINGDGATPSFLSINKGHIQLIKDDIGSAHLYDHNGSTDYYGTIFPNMLRAMPTKYRGRPDLEIWMSLDDYEKYTDQLATRSTALGDSMIVQGQPAKFRGIPVVGIPFWPDGYYRYGIPKNLVMGVQRDVLFESDASSADNIKKRLITFVMSMRVDFELINIDSEVISYNA